MCIRDRPYGDYKHDHHFEGTLAYNFGENFPLTLSLRHIFYPELEVILLTAHGNIPKGVQAIKNGAFDYITKGDDNNKIIPLISRAMAQAKKNVGEKVKTEETQSFSRCV